MGLLNSTQKAYYQGNDFGNYQFTSLKDIINQFMLVYVGEHKIITKAKRMDVAFHAQRALAELSFDTLKSCKAQEITVPASLQMILPQDYVNYTKISSVDSAGIKHILYPTSKTSNPTNPLQDSNDGFGLSALASFVSGGNTILLDKIYSNVYPGMRISTPHVPDNMSIIIFVEVTGDRTRLSIGNNMDGALSSTNVFINLFTDDVTIDIQNEDGSLILDAKSYTAQDIIEPSSGDYFLTVSTIDAENIEVGMMVKSPLYFASVDEGIPPNTFVVAVDGTKITMSNPTGQTTLVAGQYDYNFISPITDSDTWSNYKSQTPSENNNDDYEDNTYWPMNGERYGLDPQHAQANGSFYIDCKSGKIHFSSNISGKTVILDYISDSLGTDGEMQVHKFAEEAMYKWISHAILSGRANIPEYQVNRFKKERFAAIRTAKLRLSNLKLEELTQILRGKSKQIKH